MDFLLSLLLIPFAAPLVLGFVTMCCCSTTCTIYVNDNFNRGTLGADWSVSSGTITMPGTAARTTSSNALVVHTSASAPMAHAAVRVSLSADGDEAKIILAYEDDDNYLFALFIRDSITNSTVKVYERVAGVETQLGVSQTSTAALVGLQWIQASYNGESLCAVVSGSDVAVDTGAFAYTVARVPTAMAGTGVGFGTGTMTGTADFDEARFEDQHASNSLCRYCCRCTVCTPSQAATEYEVVISGVVSAGACSATCPNLNSTFILDGGCGTCSWCYRSLSICGGTSSINLGVFGASVTMDVLECTFGNCAGATTRGFRVVLGSGASCVINGESLSPQGANFFGCDHSGASCIVSAL